MSEELEGKLRDDEDDDRRYWAREEASRQYIEDSIGHLRPNPTPERRAA